MILYTLNIQLNLAEQFSGYFLKETYSKYYSENPKKRLSALTDLSWKVICHEG